MRAQILLNQKRASRLEKPLYRAIKPWGRTPQCICPSSFSRSFRTSSRRVFILSVFPVTLLPKLFLFRINDMDHSRYSSLSFLMLLFCSCFCLYAFSVVCFRYVFLFFSHVLNWEFYSYFVLCFLMYFCLFPSNL